MSSSVCQAYAICERIIACDRKCTGYMDVREKTGLIHIFQTRIYSDVKAKVKILPTTFKKISILSM